MTGKKTPATKSGTRKTTAKVKAKPFPIVGLGASAGGLEAFTAFLKATAPDSGMAYVLVHHVDPTHKSLMAELLGRQTKMPVHMAEDGMVVACDHVYVIPPNRYMEIEKGVLRLSEPTDKRGTRLPINRFLTSLAQDQGRNAVAVILSGTGTDGSAGIAEIKVQGGIVVVQDPAQAQQGGMPRSAIATGHADHIVPIAQMPTIISGFANHAFVKSSAPEATFGENARPSLSGIIATLKAHSPINFDLYKEGTLLRRIERRMVLRHLQDSVDYHALLMDSPDEAEALCRDLLISVTSFFRDPQAYAWLEKSVVPDLIASHAAGEAIRVWVPGCATGEEAYSIAMLLIEHMSELRKDIKVQIFASDVDDYALAVARTGIYPDSIEADVSQSRLDRFFKKEDHSYRVTPELRDTVVFANQNLLSDAPFSKLDMISCRNLLIYLTPQAQDRVMEIFHFALNDNGVLFLGMSETVGEGNALFKPLSKQCRVFKRVGPSRAHHLPISGVPERQMHGGISPRLFKQSLPNGVRLAEASQKILTEHYGPAAVLVNDSGETLYLDGRTDKYIKVPSGEASRDLLAMARDGLRTRISSVLRAARETGEIASRMATVQRDGVSVTVEIQAHPVMIDNMRLYLVTFQDQEPPAQNMAEQIGDHAANSLLEQELEKTRTDLRNTIRDYERSTEELKASNEEAMSMNEEFQSTNEELETSKEELQSLNEELITLNTQLQQKIDAERHLSDDLNNLLSSSGVATLFLNRERKIMRFTPTTRALFNLISADIGRPISDITSKIDDAALFDDIAQVQKTLVPMLVEVRAQNGKWYNRQILPYRTQDDKINGVVVTYSDVSDLKDLQDRTLMAQRFVENIVNTVRDPLLALNADLELVWASRSFHQLFNTSDRNVVGESLFSLSKGQWDIPELRRHLERVLPDKRPVEAFSLVIDVPGKGRIDLVLDARKLANDHPEGDMILVALDNVTEQKQARQALLDREARLNAILNAVPEAIITTDAKGIVTSYSPSSAEIFGYTQSEVVGRNVNMLIPETGRESHNNCMATFLETGEKRIIGKGRALDARHKSGATVPVHLTVSELEMGASRQFLGVIRDLTAERESRKQLEQAQKLEAVGQFTGGIAHDFNNLLTVVIGNLELVEMLPDSPDRDAILDEALEAANIGAALVAKLLLFSKKQTLAPEPLNLARVIDDLSPLLQRTLGGQITLTTDLDDDLKRVMADESQIQNAMLNLSINARDAMPDGGKLVITAQNMVLEKGQTLEDKARLVPGHYVAISVRDEGIGMSSEVLDRVFEPFFTTKEVGRGTGLGLPMMYRWARESGGDVTLDSAVGEGTVVKLYLPAIAIEKATPPMSQAATATPTSPIGEVVLLVEDHRKVRNLTRKRLEHLGYVVVEAESGAAALEQLEVRDDVALMLSDIVMPGGMDGLELADNVSVLYPSLKVILATGFAPKAKDAPYPVLRKPYNIDTLSKGLRALLDEKP